MAARARGRSLPSGCEASLVGTVGAPLRPVLHFKIACLCLQCCSQVVKYCYLGYSAQPSSPCAVALAGPGRRLRRGVAQADPSSAAQHWRKVGEVPNTPSNTNSPQAMYTPTIPTASPWRYRRHSQALNASTGAFAPPRLPCECPRAPLAPHQLFISSLSALRWVNRHASPDSTPDLRSGWPCSSSARPKQAPRSEYHGARVRRSHAILGGNGSDGR